MADVGCAGILVADTFCGPMQGLPTAGQLIAVNAMPMRAGGCAANVAIDLAKQEVAVDVLGCVGKDAGAQIVLDGLQVYGIASERITHTEAYATSRTVVLIVEGEDRRYIHMFGANQAFSIDQVDRAWLADLRVFYLGGLFALPGIKPEALSDLLQFCRSREVITVVDVVIPQNFSDQKALQRLLPDIDCFVPNTDEAALITGETDPIRQLRALCAMGAGTVVITKGEAGAMAGREGEYWQCDAYHMDAVDPSGSGDAFTSGLIAGFLHQWDVPTMLRYASAVGASATRAVGTTESVFTASDAKRFIAAHPLPITCGKY